MAALATGDTSPRAITTGLYLVALAREPDASELAVAVPHLREPKDRRQAVEDLRRALINSKESLSRR